MARALELIQRHLTRLELRGEGADPAAFRRWLGLAPLIRPQDSGDLGRRMDLALTRALAEGEERAVLIGSDCPGLTAEILEQAFAVLADHDLVLGPAQDGGYYLVGLRRPAPEIFRGIAWGSDRVLRQTLNRAGELGLRVALLPELADLDRPEDLPRLVSPPPLPRPPPAPESISVVIPALDEAANLPEAIASAAGPGVEVIVVDGGSRDQSLAVAREAGALALAGFRGRARQQNLGAALARGGTLLFLHADSRLP
ncbi:MAG: TIGR04282 family arsenosugar biosynthesis glycosyltransferase, partial [Desulfarculus sp.]|nr:TIGR04282 family arsenosugar biosynthesis glycosyltransferase [Desulfarculus sp.]